MKYEKPEMEILELKSSDVVRTSISNNGEIDEDSMIKWQ